MWKKKPQPELRHLYGHLGASLVADPATKVCYLTGGANVPGGGTLTSVYAYDTVQDKWLTPLRAFDSVRNYHAASSSPARRTATSCYASPAA
jgi:hypothetical protein